MTEGETTTETAPTGAEPVDESILARFEEMFSSRFSDEDEIFQQYMSDKDARVPPILNHYVIMRPRNPRGFGRGGYNNRGGRGMKRSYDGRDDWYDQGRQRWHQENYNRQGGGGWGRGGYGGGGGYGNQGGYGYNQGYGNQRFGRGGYGGGGGGYQGRGGYGGGYGGGGGRGGYQGQGWGGNRGRGFQRGGGQQRKWEDY